MSVEKIMSSPVVTVDIDASLKLVKQIFDNDRFHHLLVVCEKKLFGVISDRDLLKAISPNIGTASETAKDQASLNKKAHQILTRKPITLNINASVHDAVAIFNRHQISCIPIVSSDGKPVGILSWRDILKALEAQRNQSKR